MFAHANENNNDDDRKAFGFAFTTAEALINSDVFEI